MKKDFIILFFLLSCFWISCLKAPEYPIEPVIEFMSLSKNVFKQSLLNEDSIVLAFTFTDGDGDLGDNDSLNVILRDSRDDAVANSYRIPFIPEEGTANGIAGEIYVLVYSTCCYFPDGTLPCTPSTQYPRDTLTYLIQIRDRAGHWSNVIETDPIIVL